MFTNTDHTYYNIYVSMHRPCAFEALGCHFYMYEMDYLHAHIMGMCSMEGDTEWEDKVGQLALTLLQQPAT